MWFVNVLQAGNSRSLKQLAKAFLNINIQQQPRPQQPKMGKARRTAREPQQRQQQQAQRVQHDPQEDAAAVMQLYQKVGEPLHTCAACCDPLTLQPALPSEQDAHRCHTAVASFKPDLAAHSQTQLC